MRLVKTKAEPIPLFVPNESIRDCEPDVLAATKRGLDFLDLLDDLTRDKELSR